MPMSVKLCAAIHALGLDPTTVEWHHAPSLAMRPYNPATGEYEPAANDPRYIVPLSEGDHAKQTFGDHRPLSGDISQIAKVKRIEAKDRAFRDRLLAKDTADKHATLTEYGKRLIPSRPFDKRNPK